MCGVFDRPPRTEQKVGDTRERLVRPGIKNTGNGAELHRIANCESERIAAERNTRSQRWQPTAHCDRMRSDKEGRS